MLKKYGNKTSSFSILFIYTNIVLVLKSQCLCTTKQQHKVGYVILNGKEASG